jgi:hypothetical protein
MAGLTADGTIAPIRRRKGRINIKIEFAAAETGPTPAAQALGAVAQAEGPFIFEASTLTREDPDRMARAQSVAGESECAR